MSNDDLKPVGFNEATGELSSVSDYFDKVDAQIVGITWDVEKEGEVRPGDPLGKIVWDTKKARTTIRAPEGFCGRISWLNPRIPYSELHLEPVPLIRLVVRHEVES